MPREVSSPSCLVDRDWRRRLRRCSFGQDDVQLVDSVMKALLVTATLGDWAGIGSTVLLHEGSTIVAVANSLGC